VAILEENIEETQARIEQLERDLQNPLTPNSQSILLSRLNDERDRLDEAQRNIIPLYETLQEAITNQVKIIESNREVVPVDSQLLLKLVIGAGVGGILGVALVVFMDYLSDTIETADDLYISTKLPVLGAIARYKQPKEGMSPLIVRSLPQSTAAENFRSLGVKLFFAESGRWRTRTVLISSIEPGQEASEVAANLGVILAQTGIKVTIVDANLHQPILHELFDIPNAFGLTNVLTSLPKELDLIDVPWVTGLSLLPSGPLTSDAFGLLASPPMLLLLQQLSLDGIVLIVGSSLSMFADSLFMGTRVEGVILTTRSTRSRRKDVRNAIGSLSDVGANVLGLVLTNSPGASGEQIRPIKVEPNPRQEETMSMEEKQVTEMSEGEEGENTTTDDENLLT
jgi:receptor protein-tyrosine kinase